MQRDEHGAVKRLYWIGDYRGDVKVIKKRHLRGPKVIAMPDVRQLRLFER